ncbi:hypothetical protein [Facklamia sp. 7083-14-GEN3]|uniref:hypothetical protein n=1 Tax=Facklamia sp. 7083-14-GEN3 TaxID=2973478 RepID=UPI00215CD3D4|nr:hypothetical protein [Facklamia sp. 7083-14-GEN3]MCR8969301.1 hypothetical protein [Facklamia sp. 7083-14-GEN3]
MNIKLEEKCEVLRREREQALKKRQENIIYFVLTLPVLLLLSWPIIAFVIYRLGWS